MEWMIALIIAGLAAYLIGSFPTSFIMAKLIKGVDIRTVGSGNAGATNVVRTVGKLPGLITLVIDILKGVLVVALIGDYLYSYGIDLDYDFYRGMLALITVCGHIWPVFLGFRGGKGVATTLGVLAVMIPNILLASLFVWLVVFLISKYVSLASIITFIAIPIMATILINSFYTVIFVITICSVSIYKHRSNITRLLKGDESKTRLLKS